MSKNLQQESVTGILFSKDRTKILLIKRRDVPVWVLPGGGIDRQETPEKAIVREIKEETGYEVTICRKIAEYTPLNRLTRLTHFFECQIFKGRPILTSETQGISFFLITALPLVPPPYLDWIKDSLQPVSGMIRKPIGSVTYFNFFKCFLKHPILITRFLVSRFGFPMNDKMIKSIFKK